MVLEMFHSFLWGGLVWMVKWHLLEGVLVGYRFVYCVMKLIMFFIGFQRAVVCLKSEMMGCSRVWAWEWVVRSMML